MSPFRGLTRAWRFAVRKILGLWVKTTIKPDEIAPSFQQWFAKFSADPEADIISHDSSTCGCGNDPANVQRVLRSCERGGANEDRFSRHWDSGALQHND